MPFCYANSLVSLARFLFRSCRWGSDVRGRGFANHSFCLHLGDVNFNALPRGVLTIMQIGGECGILLIWNILLGERSLFRGKNKVKNKAMWWTTSGKDLWNSFAYEAFSFFNQTKQSKCVCVWVCKDKKACGTI